MSSATEEAKADAVQTTRPTEYPIHPFCNLLPRPNPEDRAGLKENIRQVGVNEPVVLVKVGRHHAVLDGQTRQELVLELWDEGVTKTETGDALTIPLHHMPDTMTPEEMLAFVESKNLRRNLSGAQKACRALEFHAERVRMAKAKNKPIKIDGDFAEYLSKTYGVNRRYFVFVNQLHKENRKLFDAVYSGAMKLEKAHKAHQMELGKKTAKPAQTAKDEYRDAGNKIVPKSLNPVFADVDLFDTISEEIRKLARKIKTLADSPGGAFLEPGPLNGALTNVATSVTKAKPHIVCRYCAGKKCDKCRKTGFTTALMDAAMRQRARGKAPAGAPDPAATAGGSGKAAATATEETK
jgi:hypothetical protein